MDINAGAKQQESLTQTILCIIAVALCFQFDQIIISTFFNFEMNGRERLLRLISIGLLVSYLQMMETKKFSLCLPLVIPLLFPTYILLNELSRTEPGFGSIVYQAELFTSLGFSIFLSRLLSRELLLRLIISFVIAFSVIFLTVGLGLSEFTGLAAFEPLCSRPTWKYVNKYAIFLSCAIFFCQSFFKSWRELLLLVLCLLGIWLLKSRVSLIISFIAVVYILGVTLWPFIQQRLYLKLISAGLITCVAVGLSVSWYVADIFSRQTKINFYALGNVEIPYCQPDPDLEFKMKTSIDTRVNNWTKTLGSVDSIMFGRGQKAHLNWKSSVDLNYVSDIADYRNPSVMSSSNYVIETYVQYGLLGIIIAILAFIGVLYTANVSAQALNWVLLLLVILVLNTKTEPPPALSVLAFLLYSKEIRSLTLAEIFKKTRILN